MATLTVSPSEIRALETEFSTEILEFENMHEQRFPNSYTGRQKFLLIWNLLTPVERTTLEDFFKARLGKYEKWDYTDSRLGESPLFLRFNEDSILFMPVKHKAFDAKIEVITC